MTTPIQSFLFDPEKGETPEGVARKRKIADLLAARIGSPRNVGEGLSSVGAAIGAILQSRKAAAGEEAGRAGLGAEPNWMDLWAKALGDDGAVSDTPAVPPITIGSAGSSGYPSAAPPTPQIKPGDIQGNYGGPTLQPPGAAPGGPAAPAYPPPMAFNGGASPPMGGAPTPTELTAFLAQGAAPTNLNLAPVFMPRLAKFLADAPGGGIKIRSGFRDVATQARLFADAVRKYGSEAAARKWVAPPGSSQHNKGAAVDLAYATPAQQKWAHDNAAAYGLTFPMSYEPWHVQPDPNFKGSLPPGSIPTAGMGGGMPVGRQPVPTMRPVQVASLDPSIGLPGPGPAPYPVGGAGLPPGAATEPAAPVMPPGTSPGAATVATALLQQQPGPVGVLNEAPSMLQPPGAPPSGGPPPMPPAGAGPARSMAMGAMPPPAPVVRTAQAGGGMPALDPRLMKYATSEWATPAQRQIAQEILKLQMERADPAYRLGLEEKRLTVDALKNKAPERMTVGNVGYERQSDGSWKAVTPAPATKPAPRPATPAEKAQYNQPANAPMFFDEDNTPRLLTGSGTTVNLNQVPVPDKGFRNVFDNDGRLVRQEIIPGSPADLEAEAAAARAARAGEQRQQAAGIISENLAKAIEIVERNPTGTAGGVGALAQNLANTEAYNVKVLLEPVKANIAFDKLQAMREASPTGGALGSVSNYETQSLQATMGSLDQGQDPKLLLFNLKRLQRIYAAVTGADQSNSAKIAAIGKAVDAGALTKEEADKKVDALLGLGGASEAPGKQDGGMSLKGDAMPPGWQADNPDRRELWDFMSPEGKARARAAAGGQ